MTAEANSRESSEGFLSGRAQMHVEQRSLAASRLTFEQLFETARLRKTWKQLRKEITKTTTRDCVDYVEFDLHSADWIDSLAKEVVAGVYQPIPPARREESKSAGAFRIITTPSLRDSLVYRHICDYAYELARPMEWKGAFFSRRHRQELVGAKLSVDDLDEDQYLAFFEVWKRYASYREHIGLGGLFHILVTTDLTNYFESIQHELLYEHLGSLGLPRKSLGVLGKLLRILRPESGHSASPAVGLPTDEIDCSRTLAHIFLFEYDQEIASFVGPDSYIRWMDDQNVGVPSPVQARMVVRQMVQSLSKQRLTLNTGKTKFLTPEQVSEEFLLELNSEVDDIAMFLKFDATKVPRASIEARIRSAWQELTGLNFKGHWDKVAKRILLLAAKFQVDVTSKEDCKDLLVRNPQLASRIFDYWVARGDFESLLWLFRSFVESGESMYEDVEIRFFESLLSSSPPDRERLIVIAEEFLARDSLGCGRPGPRVPAALLMYWFGDEGVIDRIERLLDTAVPKDGAIRRALTAILCARRPNDTLKWLSVAASVPQVGVSGLISWLMSLRAGARVQMSNPLIFPRVSAMTGRRHYDARIWLRLELLVQSPRSETLKAIHGATRKALGEQLGAVEREVANRVNSVVETKMANARIPFEALGAA